MIMKNEILKIPKNSQDSSEKGTRVTAPILWAVVALAYMFEIGAVAVVINTKEPLQYWVAISALVMPIIGIMVVFFIRAYKEELFYPSPARIRESAEGGQTLSQYVSKEMKEELEKKGVKLSQYASSKSGESS